jgi:hypothetical protein
MHTNPRVCKELIGHLSSFRQELESKLDSDSTSQPTAVVMLTKLIPLWVKLDLQPGLWIQKHVVPAPTGAFETKSSQANVLWGKRPTENAFHSVILGGSGCYQNFNPSYSDLERFVLLTGEWIEYLTLQLRQMAGDVERAYQLRQTGRTWSYIASQLGDKTAKAWSIAVKRHARKFNLPLHEGRAGRPPKV